MLKPALLFTALSTACLTSSAAFAADANAPVTRAELPALIRETLVNDPMILKDAAESLQKKMADEAEKKTKEALAANKDKLFSDPSSPTVGAADADVTIVEFFDYHCGYCKKALEVVKQLMEKDKKVKFVFKEYPILSEDSKMASKAALAVYRLNKDKYFDFHKAMFALPGNFDEKAVIEVAKKLGIDAEKLKFEMAKPEIEETLNKDKELGLAIGAQGTPAFIIGDNLYPGAVPLNVIEKAIAEVRAGKKSGDKK